MIGLLFLAALAVADAQAPPPAEPILVTGVRDRESLQLLGFVAFGEDADLDRLEHAAEAISARVARIDDNPDGRLETMVVFGSAGRADALRLYRDAIGGRHGRLTIEAMVIRVADARDGIEVDEIQVTDPGNVEEE